METKMFADKFRRLAINRTLLFGVLIVGALIAFEMFNYSTTEFALTDLLGDLEFWGIRWATILAIAFCGIDFAGIARLFTPEIGGGSPLESWYLLAAWLLAALMNAALTWWGVSIALVNHDTFRNIVLERDTILRFVPIFIAILVWIIRVLIIGTIANSGDLIFAGNLWVKQSPQAEPFEERRPGRSGRPSVNQPLPMPRPVPSFRPNQPTRRVSFNAQEPTYQPLDGEEAQPTSARRQRRF
jgi:hypothetical protein